MSRRLSGAVVVAVVVASVAVATPAGAVAAPVGPVVEDPAATGIGDGSSGTAASLVSPDNETAGEPDEGPATAPTEPNGSDEYRSGTAGSDAPRPPEPTVPGGGSGVGTHGQGSTHPINVTWTYELTPSKPGEILLHANYEFPDDQFRFREFVSDRETVVSKTNFTRPTDYEQRDYYSMSWTETRNASGPDASVTFVVDVNSTGFGKPETIDVGAWALARAHNTFWYDFYGPTNLTVADTTTEGAPVGYGGGVPAATYGFVFLGNQTTDTFEGDGQTIEVVRPTAATGRPRIHAMGTALARQSRALHVGARDDRVTAVVGPDPIRGGGAAYDTAFWMGDGEPARDADPTLLHEYVHTRQVFNFTRESQTESADWFVEASASFYESYLAWQFNYSSFADFRTVAWNTPSRVVLANESTYENAEGTPIAPGYDEGQAVLASLDYRIRVATDGDKSLQDVFREVNARARTKEVNATDLRRISESVAGRSFETFFDRYVRSQAVPDPPADPSVYPGERVPVNGSVASTAGNVDDGRVYAFTFQTDRTDEVFADPGRPPLAWDFQNTYGSTPVEGGEWSLPVDPNRTETEPGSGEATWNFTFAYVQSRTAARADDGVPDIYPIGGTVSPSGPTAVGSSDLPPAERLNVTVVDTGGTPQSGVGISLGPGGFGTEVQIDDDTDTQGRAFTGGAVAGIDVAGELDLVVDGAGERANFRLTESSLSRDAALRYVVEADGVATGAAIPDESVRVGESVTLYLLADEDAIAGDSAALTVRANGSDVATTTARVGQSSDGVTTEPTELTFQSAGSKAITVNGVSVGSIRVAPADAPGDLSTSVEAPSTALAGNRVGVNATVSAPDLGGSTSGTATIDLSVDGTSVNTTSVPLSEGDTRTVIFRPTLADVGTANLTVGSNVTLDGRAYVGEASTTVTVERPPHLSVQSTTTNDPVTVGDTLSVNATVANLGDRTAAQTVALRVGSGTRDSAAVTVAPNGTDSVALSWPTTTGDGGTYAATVATANDTATRNVTVEPPARPNFQLSSIATNGPVRAGETLSVSATVTNVGNTSGSQTISLSAINETRSALTVGLAPGESRSVTVEWATDRTDDGSYTATVATANDSASREVTVETPPADVAITSLASNTPVTVGEDLSVAATVENGGGATATRIATLAVDGTERNRTVVSVAPNGTETVRLDWPTAAGDAGTYTATVAVRNGTVVTATANESVSVRERSPDPVAEGSTSAPPTDPDGDGRFEDVDGDGNVSYRDVVVLFEQFETVAARPTTAPFDYDGDGTVSFVDLVDLFEHV